MGTILAILHGFVNLGPFVDILARSARLVVRAGPWRPALTGRWMSGIGRLPGGRLGKV